MVSLMSVWLYTASRFSLWRGRHIRLFICQNPVRTKAHQPKHSRKPNVRFCLYAMPISSFLSPRTLFSFSRTVPCCFPWRNVCVLKETVALQSLMAWVIAGVEQTHMTLSALLRCLGFSIDTVGTWKKMFLQLNPVMT